MKRISMALAATLAAVSLASAQSYRDSSGTIVPGFAPLVGCSANGACTAPVSSANPLPITGSLTANLGVYAPAAAGTPLSVSTSSSRVALPAGTTVVVYNTGSSAAYVAFGGSGVTAANTNDLIQPGSWAAFAPGSATYLAAITASGTTSLNVSGGSGLPAGAGGGGGSGGAVTISGTLPAFAATPTVNATQSGTWNIGAISTLPSLPTGSNAIGSVSVSGSSGTPTQTSVSVGTSSTSVLAASTATSFVKLCVPLGAGNGIWVRWDGGAATTAAPAEYLPPGQCDAWVKSTGFLPTTAINAIAPAAVSVSLIYN
jgi:hypothetical protein